MEEDEEVVEDSVEEDSVEEDSVEEDSEVEDSEGEVEEVRLDLLVMLVCVLVTIMYGCIIILFSSQVQDLGPQMVMEEDFVAEGVEGAPREDGEVEEGEVAAEGALEEDIRS